MERLLGDPLTDAERAVMFIHARELVGTPYKGKGRTEKAVDCLGAVWLVLYRTLLETRGILLPKPRDDYGRTPFNRQLRAGLVEWLGPPVALRAKDLRPGDIPTMRWTGEEHHVGLIVPHPFHPYGIVHADNGATGGPRVVEHGCDAVWRQRFIEGFRP
jgi:hypothetical protein